MTASVHPALLSLPQRCSSKAMLHAILVVRTEVRTLVPGDTEAFWTTSNTGCQPVRPRGGASTGVLRVPLTPTAPQETRSLARGHVLVSWWARSWSDVDSTSQSPGLQVVPPSSTREAESEVHPTGAFGDRRRLGQVLTEPDPARMIVQSINQSGAGRGGRSDHGSIEGHRRRRAARRQV